MELKAQNDYVIIKKDGRQTHHGSIIIAPSAKSSVGGEAQPPYSGTILSIGENVSDKDYKVGQRVLFSDVASIIETFNEQDYVIVSYTSILGIVNEKNIEIL